MKKDYIMNKIKGGLIVSCQAEESEPLHSSFIMSKMALAAKVGGAVAIRANGIEDIIAIKETVDLPIIGLMKVVYENQERYITPTFKEINALIEVGVDIIALDVTLRDGYTLEMYKEIADYAHKHDTLVMADVSNIEEGLVAEAAGFDMISSTLSGYTSNSPKLNGPDFNLVKDLTEKVNIPVIAEGRIFGEENLRKMLSFNPFAIVIGGAITRPQMITEKYSTIIKEYKKA